MGPERLEWGLVRLRRWWVCREWPRGAGFLPDRRRRDVSVALQAAAWRRTISPDRRPHWSAGDVKHRDWRPIRHQRHLSSARRHPARNGERRRGRSIFLVRLGAIYFLTCDRLLPLPARGERS